MKKFVIVTISSGRFGGIDGISLRFIHAETELKAKEKFLQEALEEDYDPERDVKDTWEDFVTGDIVVEIGEVPENEGCISFGYDC